MKPLRNSPSRRAIFLCTTLVIWVAACGEQKQNESQSELAADSLWFQTRLIADTARHWWAQVPGDMDGDGLADLVVIHNNSSAGPLGYYRGTRDSVLWEWVSIADVDPSGLAFASGDLEIADVDADGNQDVIAVVHPGEWTDAGASAELFWYGQHNGVWTPHRIGNVPDAVKDVSFEDFDRDGKLDLAVLTFDEHTLSIFRQLEPDSWERVQFVQDTVLHEGMHTADLNLDGYPDIVATGLIYYNPGADLKALWGSENLDTLWNNQVGDWSRNGTKTWIVDLDDAGRPEILMSHSERSGYPLMLYSFEDGAWQGHRIANEVPACHTLQVGDFDLDGNLDILAGVNKGRAVNLGETDFPVIIYLNSGDHRTFIPKVITDEGIYNGHALDFDGDGDIDIFRYPEHEADRYFLLENQIR